MHLALLTNQSTLLFVTNPVGLVWILAPGTVDGLCLPCTCSEDVVHQIERPVCHVGICKDDPPLFHQHIMQHLCYQSSAVLHCCSLLSCIKMLSLSSISTRSYRSAPWRRLSDSAQTKRGTSARLVRSMVLLYCTKSRLSGAVSAMCICPCSLDDFIEVAQLVQ